jgi:AraC-type transcriptional regulator
MAQRANPLTVRATSRSQEEWTAPVSELRVFLNALAELGHDASALLAAGGLTGANLSDADARVSCQAYGAIFARAQQRRFTPNLGLELARRTTLGAYPLLDYLVITSDTAGAGIQQLARYFRITTNPLVLDVRDEGDPVEVRVASPTPFGVEYLVSLMALHLGGETEGRFVIRQAMFRHDVDDKAALSRAYGCPIQTVRGGMAPRSRETAGTFRFVVVIQCFVRCSRHTQTRCWRDYRRAPALRSRFSGRCRAA